MFLHVVTMNRRHAISREPEECFTKQNSCIWLGQEVLFYLRKLPGYLHVNPRGTRLTSCKGIAIFFTKWRALVHFTRSKCNIQDRCLCNETNFCLNSSTPCTPLQESGRDGTVNLCLCVSSNQDVTLSPKKSRAFVWAVSVKLWHLPLFMRYVVSSIVLKLSSDNSLIFLK